MKAEISEKKPRWFKFLPSPETRQLSPFTLTNSQWPCCPLTNLGHRLDTNDTDAICLHSGQWAAEGSKSGMSTLSRCLHRTSSSFLCRSRPPTPPPHPPPHTHTHLRVCVCLNKKNHDGFWHVFSYRIENKSKFFLWVTFPPKRDHFHIIFWAFKKKRVYTSLSQWQFLLSEIHVAFPKESQLQQSRASQP